jgi:hypothetical protein
MEQIGPTGNYDLGAKLNENDRGGLNVAVTIVEGHILMVFGTQLDWLAGGPEHMLAVGMRLGQLALKLSNGAINFDQLNLAAFDSVDGDNQLPGGIEVTLNREKGLIETKLPANVEALAFTAQGAFAYGLRLMMCVKVLRPDLVPFLPDLPESELKKW